MTDGVGSENYSYNNLGQLTQLQKVIGELVAGLVESSGFRLGSRSNLSI